MQDHPQVDAFRQAAAIMRDQRYWRRNDEEEIEFLRVFTDVVREVSFHLDATKAMNIQGLTAYCRAAGLRTWKGHVSAESVLATAVDEAIERRLATARVARNTGDSTGTQK